MVLPKSHQTNWLWWNSNLCLTVGTLMFFIDFILVAVFMFRMIFLECLKNIYSCHIYIIYICDNVLIFAIIIKISFAVLIIWFIQVLDFVFIYVKSYIAKEYRCLLREFTLKLMFLATVINNTFPHRGVPCPLYFPRTDWSLDW